MFCFSLTQKIAEGEDSVLRKVNDEERFPVYREQNFSLWRNRTKYTHSCNNIYKYIFFFPAEFLAEYLWPDGVKL